MTFEWINLPEPLWIKILQQLDVKSLLNTSETCTTFNNLLENTILTDKLKLVIDFRTDKQLWEVFKSSNRKYRQVKFRYDDQDSPGSSEDFQVMVEILKLFSHCIRKIQLNRSNISYNIWIRTIETLKYVETIDLDWVTINNEYIFKGTKTPATKINSLLMAHVENKLHIDIFENVSIKEVKLSGRHINPYDQFLLNYKELNSLSIWNKMFQNDNLSNVKFSLEYLDLNYSRWFNKKHALNFIRTQTDLRRVHIHLDMYQYDILFLKHVINHNPNLEVLSILLIRRCDKLFENDIRYLDTNYSVTHFQFDCYPRNPILSEKLYILFPNCISHK